MRQTMRELRDALTGIVDVVDGPVPLLEMAKFCQADPSLLPDEDKFVENMLHLTASGGRPTVKQAKWLSDIFNRLSSSRRR